MKNLRYYRYTICDPAGEITRLGVPPAWSPFEVANKYRDALVFLRIPAGHEVFAAVPGTGGQDGRTPGPAVVFVSRRAGGTLHQIPFEAQDITSEKAAYHASRLALA